MKQTIPYWHELPDLDLYLDQVLLYVNQVVNSQESLEQKSIDGCHDKQLCQAQAARKTC